MLSTTLATICPNAATAGSEWTPTLLGVGRKQEVASCLPMI